MPESQQGYDSALARKAVRKSAARLLPFLFLCYILAYVDRVNVSFANLRMGADLGMDAAAYGLGAGIFFLGYFFFEVPSNLLLRKYGARFWIFRIMITWGIIASAMAFVSSVGQFYTLRFLLGVAEAGFFPGIILYLSSWFPGRMRARTASWFIAAVPVSGIFCGPLSGWIMEFFHGQAGSEGWRWLFLLEGLPTVVFSFFVLRCLPDSPDKARWLTDSEKHAMAAALAGEEKNAPAKASSALAAFKVPLVWIFSAVYFCAMFGLYGVSFWMPRLLQEAGESGVLKIGLFSALPWMAALAAMLTVSASSDRTGERRLHASGAALAAAAGLACCAFAGNEWQALAALSLSAAGVMSLMTVHWSIPPLFLSDWARASGIAVINSIGNTAGFFGPRIIGQEALLSGGLPAGFLICAGVMAAAAVLLIIFAPRRVKN